MQAETRGFTGVSEAKEQATRGSGYVVSTLQEFPLGIQAFEGPSPLKTAELCHQDIKKG